MEWKGLGLAVALLATEAAAASECREDVEQRLAVLAEAFDDQIRGLDIWSGSWASIYVALTMGQTIAALTVDGDDSGSSSGELAFGAVGAGVGALSAGILPLRFSIPLRNIRAEWDDRDRCALLARAEKVRAQVASEQKLSKGWLAHAANVLVNAGIGLTLALLFDNWQAGLISGSVGIAVGALNLITQPTKLGRLEEAPAAPKVTLVPMLGRHFAGAGFVLAF